MCQPTRPQWSDSHQKRLQAAEPQLAAKWIADNVNEATDETTELVKRAFRHAFYAGAGCSHQISNKPTTT